MASPLLPDPTDAHSVPPKKKHPGPSANPTWKHHVGPISKEYVVDSHARRKTRSDRKNTLCAKAFELVSKCGGEIFMQYNDERARKWTYCSNDALWERYTAEGLHPVATLRLNQMGRQQDMCNACCPPTPKRQRVSDGDLNASQLHQIDALPLELEEAIAAAPQTSKMAAPPSQPSQTSARPPQSSYTEAASFESSQIVNAKNVTLHVDNCTVYANHLTTVVMKTNPSADNLPPADVPTTTPSPSVFLNLSGQGDMKVMKRSPPSYPADEPYYPPEERDTDSEGSM